MPYCSGECPCNEFAVVMSQGCSWLWSFFFLTMWLCVCIQRETWTTFNYNVLNNASVHVNWCFVSKNVRITERNMSFFLVCKLNMEGYLDPKILAWVMCILCLSVYTVSSSLTSNILTTFFFFGLRCSSLFILLVYYWWNFC